MSLRDFAPSAVMVRSRATGFDSTVRSTRWTIFGNRSRRCGTGVFTWCPRRGCKRWRLKQCLLDPVQGLSHRGRGTRPCMRTRPSKFCTGSDMGASFSQTNTLRSVGSFRRYGAVLALCTGIGASGQVRKTRGSRRMSNTELARS